MNAIGKVEGRIERAARLRWVPLAQMRVNPLAQRDLNQARVTKLAAAFDPELMDAATVNHCGDWYYLIDGQHRIAALKLWMPSWENQQVQCWTYEGLREAEEAERFLALNDTLPVRAFAKFKVSVQAGRDVEGDVDRIVRALGLRIARGSDGISAVATLRRVYTRGGRQCCPARCGSSATPTAKPGWRAGHRRDRPGLPALRRRPARTARHPATGTRAWRVSGLISRAGQLRQSTGSATAQVRGAAAVEVINRGSGGRKLPAGGGTASDTHQR
jgi:hypothetical protein